MVSDDQLKLHVILRFLEDRNLISNQDNTHSTKYRFSKLNLHTAKQILHELPTDSQMEVMCQLLSKERQDSFVNFIYQTKSKIIRKQAFQFWQEHATRKKLGYDKIGKTLQLIFTHQMACVNRELKGANLTHMDIQRMQRRAKRIINFDPFEQILKAIHQDIKDHCRNHNLDQTKLESILQALQALVHRPIPIKYAIQSVLASHRHENDSRQAYIEFLNAQFEPVSIHD